MGVRVLLDENWYGLKERLEALGAEVVAVADGEPDLVVAEMAAQMNCAVVTRDRDFLSLWEQSGRTFTAVVVQTGAKNRSWPQLLAEAIEWMSRRQSVKSLVLIERNKLKIVRADGVRR